MYIKNLMVNVAQAAILNSLKPIPNMLYGTE
jgi:hypothetical protein